MFEGFLVGLVLATIPGYWFKKKIYVDGHEFILSNNLLGIEKVIVDNQIRVSKFALAGTHKVEVGDSVYEIDFFHMPHFLSVGISLKRGDDIIYTEKSSKK